MSTTTHLRGGKARALAALLAFLLLATGAAIADQAQPAGPASAEPARATAFPAPPSSRSAEIDRLATVYPVIGCKRPNVPSKDAKALRDVAEPLRSYLNTAMIDARQAGLALYLVSGGRSDGQQWDLRHGRVPNGHECDPAYKGHPTTAIPGRSNHRNLSPQISAADMGGALAWLHQHQSCYGIEFPVRGENWHAEITGRAPTCTIIPFDAPVARWVPFTVGETNATIAGRGGLAFEVSEIQLILKHLGFDPGGIDGRYGTGTARAMARFKAEVIKIQRATHQAVWPNTDPYVGPKTIAALRWWNSAVHAPAALAA